jgi:hypothetical protein
MTSEEFADLQPGDKVQNYGSGQVFTVIDVHDGRPIAVMTTAVNHPNEWKLVGKNYWVQRDSKHE